MKKPTEPLPTDLRFGGYLVLPVLKAFENLANSVSPGRLCFRSGLSEPLSSWVINVAYEMGMLTPLSSKESIVYLLDMHRIPNRQHFIRRLDAGRVTYLVERVLSNVQVANSNPDSEFIFDSIGLFGSVLAGSSAPGDVDIVFVARFRRTGNLIPESQYRLFRHGASERAGNVLRGRTPHSDLSCHDLREVEKIGAAYKIIWSREEGRVERLIQATKATFDPSTEHADGIVQTDAKCEAFRQACAQSPPLSQPTSLVYPDDTVPMPFKSWAEATMKNSLVTTLAHHVCLPPGVVKDRVSETIANLRRTSQSEVDKAEMMLFPFLAASEQFGTWKWNPEYGLKTGRPYKQRDLIGV
jgi:hypothetical protein